MSTSYNMIESRGETPIYDPAILDKVDFSRSKCVFKPAITPSQIGSGLIMRPLCLEDYERDYMQLLEEHVPNGMISKEQFTERFFKMKAAGDIHFITVIEDFITKKVVGSATLVNELKFLNRTTSRGRIEDVVVSKPYRGRQLGKILVETLTLLAEDLGCYMSSLEADDEHVKFYIKFGYETDDCNYMTKRFH